MAKPKVARVAKPGSGFKPSDALAAVFGRPQVTMFEPAGIVGKHLSWCFRRLLRRPLKKDSAKADSYIRNS